MLKYKLDLKPQKAFSLIELMIVVAIVGILAGIAYPSYQDSVSKSRRADAKGALLGFANAMERHFTENNDYCDAGGGGGANSCGDATNDSGSPTVFSATSPVDGGTPYYNLTINAANATSYTLFAAPTGDQANDQCGTLTLTQTGQKGFSGTDTGDCW